MDLDHHCTKHAIIGIQFLLCPRFEAWRARVTYFPHFKKKKIWSGWLPLAMVHFSTRDRCPLLTLLTSYHSVRGNGTLRFPCKARSHMLGRQSWVTSPPLMQSVRLLFALRLFCSSERICQIDLKTKQWLLPGTRLLRLMNEISPDVRRWRRKGENRRWVPHSTRLYKGVKVTTALEFYLAFHTLSFNNQNTEKKQ